MFLLVPANPGSTRQRAIKRLLLLLLFVTNKPYNTHGPPTPKLFFTKLLCVRRMTHILSDACAKTAMKYTVVFSCVTAIILDMVVCVWL